MFALADSEEDEDFKAGSGDEDSSSGGSLDEEGIGSESGSDDAELVDEEGINAEAISGKPSKKRKSDADGAGGSEPKVRGSGLTRAYDGVCGSENCNGNKGRIGLKSSAEFQLLGDAKYHEGFGAPLPEGMDMRQIAAILVYWGQGIDSQLAHNQQIWQNAVIICS